MRGSQSMRGEQSVEGKAGPLGSLSVLTVCSSPRPSLILSLEPQRAELTLAPHPRLYKPSVGSLSWTWQRLKVKGEIEA